MNINKEFKHVPLSIVRPYMKEFDRTLYEEAFNEHGTGRGPQKWRIYIPISAVEVEPVRAQIPEIIAEHLADKGLVVDDYIAGTVLMRDGRKMRMGRALKGSPTALSAFETDPQRKASKMNTGWVVISRHPLDIIQMSYRRGWTSCMDLDEGDNKSYLMRDVALGTLVAYYVAEEDRAIKNPSARIAARPFAAKGVHVLRPGSEYGTGPLAFSEIVKRFCAYISSGAPTGMYRLPSALYDDYPRSIHVHIRPGDTIDGLDEAGRMHLVSSTTDPEILMQLAAHRSTKLLQSIASHGHATIEVLERIFESGRWHNALVLTPLAQNDAATPELLERISNELKNPPYALTEAIVNSANVPEHLLVKMSKHHMTGIRCAVASHFKVTPEICEALLRENTVTVLRELAENVKTSPKVLAKLLSYRQDVSVRLRAAANLSTPVEAVLRHITKVTAHQVATRADLTEDQMRMCLHAGEYDPAVYSSLAANGSTPDSILLELAEVSEHSVVSRLFHRRGRYRISNEIMYKLAESCYEDVINQILSFDDDDALEIQLRVRRSPWVAARIALASHRNLLPDVMGLLSNDLEAVVLCALIDRDAVLPEVLQLKFLTHEIPEVRNQMAAREDTSLDVALIAMRKGATFRYSGARSLRQRFQCEGSSQYDMAMEFLSKMAR